MDNCEPQATTKTITNLVSKTFLDKKEESYYIKDNYANFEERDRKSTLSYYLKDLEITTLQCTSLTTSQQQEFITLLHTNAKLFAQDLTKLGKTNVLVHVIDTRIARPMKQFLY